MVWAGSLQRYRGSVPRNRRFLEFLVIGYISASNGKANPALSADQAIVAEICLSGNDSSRPGICQSARKLAHTGNDNSSMGKLFNELKRLGLASPSIDGS